MLRAEWNTSKYCVGEMITEYKLTLKLSWVALVFILEQIMLRDDRLLIIYIYIIDTNLHVYLN
jgi:hypothetical protein